MSKILFIALLCFSCFKMSAQTNDSLFATRRGGTWALAHVVKSGESVGSLAQQYFISQAVLTSNNSMSNGDKLKPGQFVYIPVMTENFVTTKQLDVTNLHPLYYRVGDHDDIAVVSTYAGVTREELRNMNNLHGNKITPGQVLYVGMLKMTTENIDNAAATITLGTHEDTTTKRVTVQQDAEMNTYNSQTNNGQSVMTEKGPAVFFDNAGKPGMFYAFHNTTKRGTIIKVYNPGNGKSVYVKVLGPLPETKQYANSIIGVSSSAKEALGETGDKLWCELSFASY